ncbi:hypothetical protein F909_00975 [Acinetobacter sp. ANC 3929]|uniref:phage tail protein n=1 Tax=Acinetobacter sp. ANC 3929 TaxID=1217707 RepID=UPI0002D08AE2|nr:phage tail protein [Acinetobacter sp. ANC 3929]ENW82704.1 hypothetical protein F909_00975 [Acinetobacter sp. ANC 3929]
MQALVQLKPFLIERLPLMSADKCHPLIVNGTQKDGYMDYTVRILILDYRGDPIEVLMLIRTWLESKNLHLDSTGKDIQLSFNSEIIDSDTFDLEIDFPQRDKIVFDQASYHICPPIVWCEKRGGFFPAGE